MSLRIPKAPGQREAGESERGERENKQRVGIQEGTEFLGPEENMTPSMSWGEMTLSLAQPWYRPH